MTFPELILFDFGNTLMYEDDISNLRGYREIFRHVTKNPRNCTPEDLDEFGGRLFQKLACARENNYEPKMLEVNRLQYEYFGLEFDIPQSELELIFWKSAASVYQMPETSEMLSEVKKLGIRTAVVSNLGWSGRSLEVRINECLPDNDFEFAITSSDYVFRKPDSIIYELALRKADVPAEKTWFCGDTVSADLGGARNVGIFPVWFDEKTIPVTWREPQKAPGFEHLHITKWSEMTEILKKMK